MDKVYIMTGSNKMILDVFDNFDKAIAQAVVGYDCKVNCYVLDDGSISCRIRYPNDYIQIEQYKVQ